MKHSSIRLLLSAYALFCLTGCATSGSPTTELKEAARATQRLGEEQYRYGQYTSALKNLLEAEKSLPGDPQVHNSLGLVYLAKERPGLAEIHFKKALELKPDYPQAQNNLGGLYMQEKKWTEAIAIFKQVSDNLLYPTPEVPLSNLGWAYYHQNMYKQASIYFNRSLDFRPHFINAVHGLASVYLRQRNYSKALSYIQASLKKKPEAAILHADLAKAYEGIGNYARARNAWAKVLKLVPERSPLAKEAISHLSGFN